MPSTSTTGSNRRVPPPRGLPPRHPSLGIPFHFVKRYGLLRVQSDPHAEVRRLRIRRQKGPLSLLPRLFVPCLLRLCAGVTSFGAVGRVSRLRRRSTTAIAHRTSSLLCTSSAKSMCTGAAGRAFPAATAFDVMVVFGKVFRMLTFFSTDRITYSVAHLAVCSAVFQFKERSKCVLWSSVSPLEKRGKGLTKSASRMDDQRSSSTGGAEGRGSDDVGFRLANALFPVGLQNETQGTLSQCLNGSGVSWVMDPFRYPRYAVHVHFAPCMRRIFDFLTLKSRNQPGRMLLFGTSLSIDPRMGSSCQVGG